MRKIHDFIVIGGGILGIATAYQLTQRYPGCSVVVLEKESEPAQHQTGRNSGVIHAGVYYKPGSLKAKFCKQGNQQTIDFCDLHGIEYDQCGKLLVATSAIELERMQALVERCAENELKIEVLDQAQLQAREPNIAGLGAIFVPSTGIVNFAEITRKLAELVVEKGGEIHYNCHIERLEEFGDRITAYAAHERYQARILVACAGVQSDRLVKMLGRTPEFQIVPFRGEYFRLAPQHNHIVNHLIYPIPDPSLPFLGVHLTRMIDGSVTVGPNAVLAFSREGYQPRAFSWSDTTEMLSYPGLRKLVFKHFRASVNELKNSINKSGYLSLVQKYCPQLQLTDLQSHPSGIRAQAVRPDGSLVDDFLFETSMRALIVCNAPSPAATSALPISEYIVEQLEKQMRFSEFSFTPEEEDIEIDDSCDLDDVTDENNFGVD